MESRINKETLFHEKSYAGPSSAQLCVTEDIVKLTVPGAPEYLPQLEAVLAPICRSLVAASAEDRSYDVVTAVFEAFDAFMLHNWNEPDKRFTVLCHLSASDLAIELQHNGNGFDWLAERSFCARDMPPWQVCIEALMDNAHYQQGSPNRLRLVSQRVRRALKVAPDNRIVHNPIGTQLPIEMVVGTIQNLGGPEPMCQWLWTQDTPTMAWSSCQNPLWLLLLSEALGTDRKQQVAAIAQCVQMPQQQAHLPQVYTVASVLRHALIEYQTAGSLASELAACIDRWPRLVNNISQWCQKKASGLYKTALSLRRLGRAAARPDLATAIWSGVAVVQSTLILSPTPKTRRWLAHVIRRAAMPAWMLQRSLGRPNVDGGATVLS